MQLLDSHSHLDAAVFDADREAVLARAQAAGVTGHILPATHAAAWDGLGAICRRYPRLYPAYGLHPVFLDQHHPAHLDALRARLAAGTACVAVGEIGLDYFDTRLDRDRQQRFFEAQLALAREFALPVIIHARHAFEAVIHTLRRFPGVRGVVHSFSGSAEQARQLDALGFLLGIGGAVTYPRAQRLKRTVATLPLHQLLLETDSPDQPACAQRGQRNEPMHLVSVLDCVSALRQTPREAIAAATTANARRLFGLPG